MSPQIESTGGAFLQVLNLRCSLDEMYKRPGNLLLQFEELSALRDALHNTPDDVQVRSAKRGFGRNGTVMLKKEHKMMKVQDHHGLFALEGLTAHRFSVSREGFNTAQILHHPASDREGTGTDSRSGGSGVCRPCVLNVECILQVTVPGYEEPMKLAVGEGKALSSAVLGEGRTVVGISEFRPSNYEVAGGQQLAQVPSVLQLAKDFMPFKAVVPLHCFISNLIARKGGKLFLPSIKSTARQ
jgi:hypothetical protein